MSNFFLISKSSINVKSSDTKKSSNIDTKFLVLKGSVGSNEDMLSVGNDSRVVKAHLKLTTFGSSRIPGFHGILVSETNIVYEFSFQLHVIFHSKLGPSLPSGAISPHIYRKGMTLMCGCR